MRTFTIILADDEKQILQGMLSSIPWTSLGYRVVATADNGKEALELAKQYHPDLLISDIKMPFMTGLELAQNIHENFMQIKVVLFSGWDEFEFARSAIRYGVSEYMLKPIDYPEMNKLLKRIHEELEAEYDARLDRERQKKIYQESLPLLRQRFFMQLLRSGKQMDNINQQMEALDVNLNTPYIQVMEMSIPEPDGDVLTAVSVAEMIDEMLGKVCRFYSARYADRIIYLLCLEEASDGQKVMKLLDEAAYMVRRILKSTFSCGIGLPVSDLKQVKNSYQQAKEALEYNLVSEDASITLYNDILPYDDGMIPDWQNATEDLEYSIKHGAEQDVRQEVALLLEQLQQCHYNFNEYQIAIMEIIFSLSKLYRKYDITDGEGMSGSKHMAMKLLSLHDGLELNNWLLHYCVYTNHAIQERRVDQNIVLALQAKEYVDRNYSDPELSLDMICQKLHISASHFSKVFRKEFGTSFLGYLTDKRIEEAERLLLTTEYKSREIGEMVGYIEPNYFSYVFKKTGMSLRPSIVNKGRRMNSKGNGLKKISIRILFPLIFSGAVTACVIALIMALAS